MISAKPYVQLGSITNSYSCAVSGTEDNAGGSLSVNGINIQVPKNLIAQFPVAWVPWKDVCGAGADGYEVSIFGNMVNGVAIAAQIEVGAQFLVS